MHISLFPNSEPDEVGHLTIKDGNSNSMFPTYHASGAIPETEAPINETVEAMIRVKEKIINNMSKYSDSSSDNSSHSDSPESNLSSNPLQSGLSEIYSGYSSKYSVLSDLSHIPVKPMLPHHHVHNPHHRVQNQSEKDTEDSENVNL
jgi:hypothetical protein